MTDTEIGDIDYTTIDVDKHVTYDSLEGRVVIITGGGQGIGRGYAHYFAAQGAIPVIAEYDEKNGANVAREVQEKQGQALAIRTDVADINSATELAEKTLSAFGRIDVLINNAAVFSAITMAPFWELPVAEWERAVQVNINGAFYCSRAVVPAMREARWGHRFAAGIGGLEYTFFQIAGRADLGLIAEISEDDRDSARAPAVLSDNDVFVGLRLTLNDDRDTTALAGLAVDRLTGETLMSIEAERRLSDNWKFEFEARLIWNTSPDGIAHGIRNDDFFTLRLARFF